MSARLILANVVVLVGLFWGFAALTALLGDFSWPGVATLTLVVFAASLLVEGFFARRDRASSDS